MQSPGQRPPTSPCSQGPPGPFGLNPAASDVKGNLTVATLSPTGKIFIYNNTGSVDVVVDVLAGSRNRQSEGVDGGAPTITMVRFS